MTARRLYPHCMAPACPCGGSALEPTRQLAGLCQLAARAATQAAMLKPLRRVLGENDDGTGLRVTRGRLTRISGVIKNAAGKDAVRVRCHERGHEYVLILTAWTAHIFGTRGCAVCCSGQRRKKASQ